MRIGDFMRGNLENGFGSLEEVADAIAGVQPAPTAAEGSVRAHEEPARNGRTAGGRGTGIRSS